MEGFNGIRALGSLELGVWMGGFEVVRRNEGPRFDGDGGAGDRGRNDDDDFLHFLTFVLRLGLIQQIFWILILAVSDFILYF